MTGKGKRRRADTEVGLSDTPNPPQQDKAYPNDPLSPATKQDQLTWKGYCEIESEPVNNLLSRVNDSIRGRMQYGDFCDWRLTRDVL